MKRQYSVKDGKIQGKTMLEKSASDSISISRLPFGEIGYSGLKTDTNGVIREQCHSDLRWPSCIQTYKSMSLDSTIRSANNIYDLMISRTNFRFQSPEGASESSLAASKYLNWCMDNMDGQTWLEFISEVNSLRIYGFHVAEKVYTKVEDGEYAGKLKWAKLATRAQDTIKGWRWDKNGQDLTHVVQDLGSIYDRNRYSLKYAGKTEVPIERKKFLLFRFDPKKDNPQGTSPLDGCYISWKYKTMIEDYQAVGVSKDLGGLAVIGIHVEALTKALADPSSNEARNLAALETMAENLHAGEKSYAIKPIAYDEHGKELYTFSLEGIQGGGKQYSTTEIIKHYQNEILTVYSASMLKMGQDTGGSYALSDNMQGLLQFGIEHHLNIILDQINDDLVPQTLALNGWRLAQSDQPRMIYDDITSVSLDELGKLVQRAVTSGAMSVTRELDMALYDAIRVPKPTYTDAELIPETHKSAQVSNSGEGNGKSGTGNTQMTGDKNLENAS